MTTITLPNPNDMKDGALFTIESGEGITFVVPEPVSLTQENIQTTWAWTHGEEKGKHFFTVKARQSFIMGGDR